MKLKPNVQNWQIAMALVNAARPLGLGVFHPAAWSALCEDDAKKICGTRKEVYLDYVDGRPIKTRISDRPCPDLRLYDRDQGEGAGVRALRDADLLDE